MAAVNWLDFVRCCRRREAAFSGQFGSPSARRGRVPSTGSEDVMLCEGMNCRAMPYDQDMVIDSATVDPESYREPRALRAQALTYIDGNGYKPDAHYKYVSQTGLGNSAGQLHVVPHQPHHGCRILFCAFFSVLAVSLSGSLFYLGRYFIDPEGTQFWQSKSDVDGRRPDRGEVDCSGSMASWSEVQRAACCEKKGVGCPKDGDEDLHSSGSLHCSGSVKNWSTARRRACCEREGVGCSTDKVHSGDGDARHSTKASALADKDDALDCGGSTVHWSASKRTACCTQKGVGCQTDKQASFRCDETPAKLAESWTRAQRDWCCIHKQVRCERTGKYTPSTSTHFECRGSSSEWSREERVFCCINMQLGCSEDSNQASSTQRPSPSKTHLSPPAVMTTPPAEPARSVCAAVCEAGGQQQTCRQRLDEAVLHTFAGKSDACSLAVTKVGHQCPICSSCAPQAHLCRKETTQAPQSKTPSESDSQPSSPPYDCIAGFAHWESNWSDDKKAWCCKRGGLKLGCPHPSKRRSTVSTSAAPPQPSTTFFLPFDCLAGYANWAKEWSSSKKSWCCQHTQRGCMLEPNDKDDDGSEDDKKQDDKDVDAAIPSQGSGPPFDCSADFLQWEAKWSLIKKAWCCQHKQRGCPPRMTSVPYNCNAGLEHWKTHWSLTKSEWCCRNTGKGCETHGKPHFDCVAGYSKWESLWSHDKKKFCCARVDCHSTD